MPHRLKIALKRRAALTTTLAIVLLSTLTPALAQEAVPAAAANSATWIGYFIFAIGLIAIGVVGVSVLNRRGPRTAFASNEADEELIDDNAQ